MHFTSPCRKRSPAKGVWQKSDEKSDKNVRKSDRKVTESVPKTKKNDRTPFAALLLRHPDYGQFSGVNFWFKALLFVHCVLVLFGLGFGILIWLFSPESCLEKFSCSHLVIRQQVCDAPKCSGLLILSVSPPPCPERLQWCQGYHSSPPLCFSLPILAGGVSTLDYLCGLLKGLGTGKLVSQSV